MEKEKNNRFHIAGGSVPGTDHTKPGEPFWRNNNDAYAFHQDEQLAIAIVSDGCGSSEYSEVGAHIACRLVIEECRKHQEELDELPVGISESEPGVFHRIRTKVIASLKNLAHHMGTSTSEVVRNYLLSTVIGCIATANRVTVFSIGDGVIAVNGQVRRLGPFANNEPPYLTYAITGSTSAEKDSYAFAFRTETFEIADFKDALIGTDGVESIIDHEHQLVSGIETPVGPLSQFWTEDRFVKNPDMVRRRLAQFNREHAVLDAGAKHPRIQKGMLHDDTTLIVIRKKEVKEIEVIDSPKKETP